MVGSIHFKTGRDISCYVWPLVVLGMEENYAECGLFLLQLCLFTQQEEQCLAGGDSKSPLLGRSANWGMRSSEVGQSGWGTWSLFSRECGRGANVRKRMKPHSSLILDRRQHTQGLCAFRVAVTNSDLGTWCLLFRVLLAALASLACLAPPDFLE